jgi:hypothetical protein
MNDCKQAKMDIRQGNTSRWHNHLEECEDCRLFAENQQLLSSLGMDTGDVSADTLTHLFAQIQSETKQPSLRFRLASLPGGFRFWTGFATALLVALFVLLFKRRVDFDIYPSLRYTLELIGMGAVLMLHLWLVIRPAHRPPLRYGKRLGLTMTTIIIVALPLMLPMAHHDHPDSLNGVGADLFSAALACFSWGSLIGAVLVVVGGLLLRGGKKASRFNVPLLLAAGMLALFCLHLHCPIVHPLHIALGHTSILIGVWTVVLIRTIARHTPRR